MTTAELAREITPDGRIELNLLGKATTLVSANADLALRTAAASLVGATFAPIALSSNQIARQRELLPAYADLARRPADDVFPEPDGAPDVRVHWVYRGPFTARRGDVELIRFPSRFEGLHPERQGKVHGPNGTVWAQYWRHEVGPRPTILVCHGFAGSGYLLNSSFFSLPWFYRKGYDVCLVTLPHHGRRRTRYSPYSGSGLFADGFVGMTEALAQAVHDIRSLVTHLLGVGVPQVGMTGLSLGGYMTGLLAATEPRLAFAVPNAAVTFLPDVIDEWWPASTLLHLAMRRAGADDDLMRDAMRVTSPLNYPAVLAKERLFVIGGLGDRLAPPVQSRMLWEHWDRPRLHWFPGNHVLHVNRAAYQRRMVKFFEELGFVA